MVVQFQTSLHAVEVLELDEREPAAFLGLLLLRGYPDGDWVNLAEVVGDGFLVCSEREISLIKKIVKLVNLDSDMSLVQCNH